MAADDIEPEKLNPWLKDKLESREQVEATRADVPLPFILEIDQQKVEGVLEELTPMAARVSEKIDIPDTPLMFIPAMFPRTVLQKITEIDGLKQVHYDMPVQMLQLQNVMPFEVLNFEKPAIRDPLLGKIEMNPISMPDHTPLSQIPLTAMKMGLPAQPFTQASSQLSNISPLLPSIHSPKLDKVAPTSEVFDKAGLPLDNEVTDTKIGVLDTGVVEMNHRLWMKDNNLKSFTGEPPVDNQGHGTHTATTACGGVAETRFGRCKGMADAVGGNIYLGKVLSNLGFGSTEWILRGMQWMIENHVDVVNMSLGGGQQGPVQSDPQVKVIEQTADEVNWIIAAGNSGVDGWTVGSPGVAPSALTVAAFSTVTDDVADFSSRGPSGEYYKEHQDKYEEDLEAIGEDLRKPDVGGYGGGPTGDHEHDEIYSGTQGKSDAGSDILVDGYCAMRGTCLVGDTKILTNPSGVKEIKDISKGDKVYSFDDGQLVSNPVNGIMDNGVKDIYRVELLDRSIMATANHPILTVTIEDRSHLKQEAKELYEECDSYKEVSEIMGIPEGTINGWFNSAQDNPQTKRKIVWKTVEELEEGDKVVVMRGRPNDKKTFSLSDVDIPDSLSPNAKGKIPDEMNEDVCKALGFFLGDGWITDNKGRSWMINIAKGEHEEMEREILDMWEEEFDLDFRVDNRDKWYYAYSKRVGDLLDELGFNKPAEEKKVPDWVFSLCNDEMEAFLEGYIMADGWKETGRENPAYRYETTSKAIAEGMHFLSLCLGYKTWDIKSREREMTPPNSPEPITVKTYKGGLTKSKFVGGSGDIRGSLKYVINTDDFILRSVEDIEYEGEEKVYDIEVDDAHNFLANGIVAHNSMASPQVAGLLALAREKGLIDSVQDVKDKMAKKVEEKDEARGYGLLTWEDLQ